MALEISTTQATGMDLRVTIEKLESPNAGYFWNPTAAAFQSAPAWNDKKITISEGSAEGLGTYAVSVSGLGDAGLIRVRIHDENDANNATIACGDTRVMGGSEVSQSGDAYAVVASGTHGNAALKTIADAILADTGTDGVVVAAGSKTGYKLASDGIDLILCADGATLWKNATVHGAVVLMGVTAGAGTVSETFTKYGYVVTSTNDGTNRTATSVA